MPDGQTYIPRWEDAPPGFLPKANQQLDEIERGIRSGPVPPTQVRRGAGSPVFLARITGSEPIGDNRWKYSWENVYLAGEDAAAYPGEQARSGSLAEGYALNGCEFPNSDSGLQGHGVDIDGDDYPAGFEVQPITTGVVVMMFRVYNASSGAAHVFTMPNADDGTCEAE